MDYPESVLTRNKKGETEVRTLIRRGTFTEYDYRDPETGKALEKGKRSIILKSRDRETHYFLIPVSGNRFLTIIPKDEKPGRKVWDGKKAVDA